jgi:hypothetical protein
MKLFILGFSFWKAGVGALTVSLGLLILFIAYRKLLQYLGKGQPVKEDYCVLYGLEDDPASGTIEIYYTSEQAKQVSILLLDSNLELLATIDDRICEPGGTIIRLDTTKWVNGQYFFGLKTDNQQTMKKMTVQNISS